MKNIRNRVVSSSKNIYQSQSKINQQNVNQLSKFSTKKSKTYTKIKFELKNEFIYNLIQNRRRLCISIICETKVFRMTYDENQHVDRHRFYQRIIDVFYVFRLFKKFRFYFEHCSKCQLNQIKRHRLYEKLIFIFMSSRSFHTLIINRVL